MFLILTVRIPFMLESYTTNELILSCADSLGSKYCVDHCHLVASLSTSLLGVWESVVLGSRGSCPSLGNPVVAPLVGNYIIKSNLRPKRQFWLVSSLYVYSFVGVNPNWLRLLQSNECVLDIGDIDRDTCNASVYMIALFLFSWLQLDLFSLFIPRIKLYISWSKRILCHF